MGKSSKILEKKCLCSGIRAKSVESVCIELVDDKKRVIEAKFSSFGNIDSDRDILVAGAFKKSIDERGPHSATNRKIGFLWQHMIAEPIGHPLEIYEKEDGAYAALQFSDFDAVPRAKQAYCQLKDGDINQFSFGFEYIFDKMDYDEEKDAFVVREVKLHEISVVTFGANEETEFMGELKRDGDFLQKYLKMLFETDTEKYNNIKRFINRMQAEPARPLTSSVGLFDRIGSLI